MYKARNLGIPSWSFRKELHKDIRMMNAIEEINSQKYESIKQMEDFRNQAGKLK